MKRFITFFLALLTCCSISMTIHATASAESNATLNARMAELSPEERNIIQIFQNASPKVVYVHRLSAVRKYNSMNVSKVPSGAGSGIIWDTAGHIVTNFHVIKDADDLAITLNGLTVPVKVIGKDPRKDLAVLAIKDPKALAMLKDFKPFSVIHSKDLLVGQKAIAIGNPFGLDHSLTVGVISALGRKVPGIGGVSIRGMIQTDASVNPGNSGGPLLDSTGRLIGLNTMIYSRSGTSTGVGFVVPADEIERVVTQIIKFGRVKLAGIGIHQIEPNIAKQFGIKKGIVIGEVLPKSPAAQAGLRATARNAWGQIALGDIIVALNGHPVPNYDDLYNLLTGIQPGDSVNLTIVRQGKKQNIKVKTIDIAMYQG